MYPSEINELFHNCLVALREGKITLDEYIVYTCEISKAM